MRRYQKISTEVFLIYASTIYNGRLGKFNLRFFWCFSEITEFYKLCDFFKKINKTHLAFV